MKTFKKVRKIGNKNIFYKRKYAKVYFKRDGSKVWEEGLGIFNDLDDCLSVIDTDDKVVLAVADFERNTVNNIIVDNAILI